MRNTRAVTGEIRRSKIRRENHPKNKQTNKQTKNKQIINKTQNTKMVTGEYACDSTDREQVIYV